MLQALEFGSGQTVPTVRVLDDRVALDWEGEILAGEFSTELQLRAAVEVEFQVPRTGGAMTPVFTDLRNVVMTSTEWLSTNRFARLDAGGTAGSDPQRSELLAGLFFPFESTGFLGEEEEGVSIVHQMSYIRGDRVRLRFGIRSSVRSFAGAFAESFELRFRTLARGR